MKNFKTHQQDVNKEILVLLLKRVPPGSPVTDREWDLAYEIVWTMAAIDTMSWITENIDPAVKLEFQHGR